MTLDANIPPEWFEGFMGEVCGLFPSWQCTPATIRAYWRHLHMLTADELAHALAEHAAQSKFAPSVAELKAAAVPADVVGLTAAEAWDEMRRNRKVGVLLKYEERPEAHARLSASIRWSSEAVRRAAEAVDWTNGDWMTEQIPTIRAQFERYYNAIKGKTELLDRKSDADQLVRSIGSMGGLKGLAQLYGPDYADPTPDEPRASFEQRMDDLDPDWREGAFPDGPEEPA